MIGEEAIGARLTLSVTIEDFIVIAHSSQHSVTARHDSPIRRNNEITLLRIAPKNVSIAVQVEFDRLALVMKFEKGRLSNRLSDNEGGEISHKKFTVDR